MTTAAEAGQCGRVQDGGRVNRVSMEKSGSADPFGRRRERVILAAVCTGDTGETEESLKELEELADTAGADVIAVTMQNLDNPVPGTYLGAGKIEEIHNIAAAEDADAVICDDELTPAQMKNLENMLDCAVLDRTMLILDIFAMRAHTSEGQIQVELAQLQYRLSRLEGSGAALSRLGGGIGTRGPGEKKLETNRRLIRKRISRLKAQLREVEQHRELLHEGRKRKPIPSAAIVGYTNAGKSTLLNALTGAGVPEEDRLFATLDPTTRKMVLPDGQEVLLTDTVGFIRKLPHHLINAFRSTLEEARNADVILHVVDSSNPQRDRQMEVVYETLRELGIGETKIITLFNKCDRAEAEFHPSDPHADRSLAISARTGENLEQFQKVLMDVLSDQLILITRVYGYEDAGKIQLIRRFGRLLEEEYLDDGIHVKAYVPPEIYGRV